MPSTVAGAVGLKLGGGDEISAGGPSLGPSAAKKLLLVLDSCEHVVDAAAALTETVVRLCPHTTVLATSREVLRIDGEYVYRVPPLDVPPAWISRSQSPTVLGHSAVQLFVARTSARCAQSSRPDGRETSQRLSRSVGASTASRSPSNLPPLALRRSASGRLPRASTIVSGWLTSGDVRTALPRHQTCSVQRSIGAMNCCLRPNAACCADWRSSPVWVHARGGECRHERYRQCRVGYRGRYRESRRQVACGIRCIGAGPPLAGCSRRYGPMRSKSLRRVVKPNTRRDVTRNSFGITPRPHRRATPGSQSEQSTIDDMARYVREIDNVRAALDWSLLSGRRFGDRRGSYGRLRAGVAAFLS